MTESPFIALIDTNVFIGACLGAGASIEVIARCLLGEIVPPDQDLPRMAF